jgi:hypothetical protein
MRITYLVQRCLDSFKIVSNLDSIDLDTSEQVHEEAGRFRIWTSNVSAHINGRSSLEHKLRDSPELSAAITKYLEILLSTLESIKMPDLCSEDGLLTSTTELRTGESSTTTSDQYDDNSSDADNFEHVDFETSGSNVALEEASEIVSCLFRLSMAFRSPARSENIACVHNSRTNAHELGDMKLDTMYVKAEFPGISSELAERYVTRQQSDTSGKATFMLIVIAIIMNLVANEIRLGEAITKRRRYMRYREEQHQEFAKSVDSLTENAAPDDFNVVIIPPRPAQQKASSSQDHEFDASSTRITVSPSSFETEDRFLQVLPYPETAARNLPFTCVLCYHTTIANDEESWCEHIKEDLLPYVCLFEVRILTQSTSSDIGKL